MDTKGKNKFKAFLGEHTQQAFTDFFDFYFTRLRHFSTLLVKSDVLAEEIVLDIFMKLWEQRDNLSQINNIETYLFISVRNKSINVLKKEQKFSFDMLEDSHVQLVDYKQSAEKDLIEDEMFEHLYNAVNCLPSKCKVIFKLIREDGLNRNEVAKILDVSVKTVDNQVSIAVKKIAEQMNIDLTNPFNSKGLVSFLLTL